ncbi:phage tail domain-containing protein [Ornithobacterium rhinotracheale]|uniref:phage tail domain-containing protein n=1 Tax=Ornithobacterium rhinotracheale TaxID=28251 RepID=UPI0040365D41
MIEYYINGILFKDLKVFVKESIGLIDPPSLKKVNTIDWEDYHGVYADLTNRKFEPRKITLKCFVTGDNWTDLYYNYNTFLSLFQQNGLQELILNVPFGLDSKHYAKVNSRPLPFYVYINKKTELSKRIKDGEVVGEFDIELIEPNPFKRTYIADEPNVVYSNSTQENPIICFTGSEVKELINGSRAIINLSGRFRLVTFVGEIEDLININLTNSIEIWKEL